MCLLVFALALSRTEASVLTRHMVTHIVAMSVVAPLVVRALMATGALNLDLLAGGRALTAATLAQLALLWAAHAPSSPIHGASAFVPAVFQLVLLASAIVFWAAIFAQRGPSRWRAIVALLLTGKLFCLLAALLVFAPRALYAGHAHHAAASLADQQLAGLLMISACPITYVGAAIVITARWVLESERGVEPSARWRSGDV